MQVRSTDFDIIVREARNKIDYNYYGNYSLEREQIQNSVIAKILMIKVTEICNQYNIREKCDQSIPLLVMTTGSVGVGKTTVINWLISKSYIEMQSFLMISVDTIRAMIPESQNLLKNKDFLYIEKTQKESGLISELCVHVALHFGKSVIIDGTILNIECYFKHVKSLKMEYKTNILLLHVSANVDTIKERIQQRFKVTNIYTPMCQVENTLEFKNFNEIVDRMISVDNNGPVPVLIHPWHLKWNDLIDLLGPNRDLSLSTASTVALGVSVRRKKSCDNIFSSPLRSSFYINESEVFEDNSPRSAVNKELPPLIFVPNETPDFKNIRKREKNLKRYRKPSLVKLPEIDMNQLSLSQSFSSPDCLSQSFSSPDCTKSTSANSWSTHVHNCDDIDENSSHDPTTMVDTIDTSILQYIKCVKKFIKTVDDDIQQLNEEIGCVYDTSLYGKGFDSRTHAMKRHGDNDSQLTITTSNTLLTDSVTSLGNSSVMSPSLKIPRHSSVRESLERKRSKSMTSTATMDSDSDDNNSPTANSKGCESCRRDGFTKCPMQSSKSIDTIFSFPMPFDLNQDFAMCKRNLNNTI